MSQITGTGDSCSQFTGGTAQTFSTLVYTVRNGLIYRLTPSGFAYWVRVTASAGTSVIRLRLATSGVRNQPVPNPPTSGIDLSP